jgi:altronate dehydratase
MLTAELNENRPVPEEIVRRFVSFGHTEGCGATSGHSEDLLVQTLLGYLNHPMVRFALVLEHGCEKVHNEYLRAKLREAGFDPAEIGWASIQLDGGIEETRNRIRSWFAQLGHNSPPISVEEAGLESVGLGVLTAKPCPTDVSRALAVLVNDVVGAGGTVVIPSPDLLLQGSLIHDLGISPASVQATLPYGATSEFDGLHLMDMPTDHWVERLSGIGASGVEVILAYTGDLPLQGHPLVPVIQVGCSDSPLQISSEGFDLLVSQDDEGLAEDLYRLLLETASRTYVPEALQVGNVDFQMTRGPLGFSV